MRNVLQRIGGSIGVTILTVSDGALVDGPSA
jgi:hypothetical protein